MDRTDKIKLTIAFIVCIAIGVSISYLYAEKKTKLTRWIASGLVKYVSQSEGLKQSYESLQEVQVDWSQLLPENEKTVLTKYQQRKASTPSEFTENILRSLEASTDVSYNEAMISVNTVDTFDGEAISIAGFIVPIDYSDEKGPANIFVVPYFGACIHFPPPPPNQIIFAQLEGEFAAFERWSGIKRLVFPVMSI